MPELAFADAIDRAVEHAMGRDPSVVVFGEDVPAIRRTLATRFGTGRVRGTPISESAFLGAGVGAAMAGLRPIVEIMLVDFLGVCFDALLNHAAKLRDLSGGRWGAPLVVRAACGGGYGDAGQHEQSLWGLLAGVPGLKVVVPSTPADAAGLMRSAIDDPDPVVFLEHKLLAANWLDWMAGASRPTVSFDVPAAGAFGEVSDPPVEVPIGVAAQRRSGSDLLIVSVGVGVHRSLEAAARIADDGIDAAVLDLRTVAPLDVDAIIGLATETDAVLVVDEDYLHYGLAGEVAAVLAEAGAIRRFARVGPTRTIPYARPLAEALLPNASEIADAARALVR